MTTTATRTRQSRAIASRRSFGDVVQHTVSGQDGVVVGRVGGTRIRVQTTPGVTVVWYANRTRLI